MTGKEAEHRIQQNDYSQPHHRGQVLGRMHQIKQSCWSEHLRVCEQESFHLCVQAGVVAGEEEFLDLLIKHGWSARYIGTKDVCLQDWLSDWCPF